MKKILLALLLLALVCASPARSQTARATLLFAGDLMAHSPQLAVARRKKGYDFAPSFAAVKAIVSAADLAVANFETTLGGGRGGYTGYPCFSTPDEYAQAVKSAGFDVLTTANNHCMDRRFTGIERTVVQLRRLGFDTCGTYAVSEDREHVLVRDVNGIKIAILSWTYGTNGISVASDKKWSVARLEAASEDLARARSLSPDIIVALPHIGTEYLLTPPRHVVSFVEKVLSWGVQLVIASHPHVVQPFELRLPRSDDRSPAVVAWSMGNFISNQRPAPRDMGVIARVTVEKSGDVTRVVSADAIPTWVQVRTSKGARVSRVLPLTTALKNPAAFQISASDLKRLKGAHFDFTGRVLGKSVLLKNARLAYAIVPSSEDRFSTAKFDEREKKRAEAAKKRAELKAAAAEKDAAPSSGRGKVRKNGGTRRIRRSLRKNNDL
ncbi:MAG: CapA family protein [Pyramidobacter sp.]|nr:CapA family protein [Pyramidobacter sp.]